MRRKSAREITLLLDEVVDKLVSRLDVTKIILFGSCATDSYSKDSDLDLFVIANMREKGIGRYALVSEILEPRKMPMDIIVKTPAEVKRREKYFDPFMSNIQIKGKVLYEKKG